MKRKILYLIIGILCLNMLFNVFKTDEGAIDYKTYTNQRDVLLDSLKTLNFNLKKQDEAIKNIENYIIKGDSIIDSANPEQLDSLFITFFDRLGPN